MDEPFSLPVGTPVSAKYRGAFCEATIEKVEKHLICRIQYKDSKAFASVQLQDILPSNFDSVEDLSAYKFQINDEILVKSQNGTHCPAIIHKISDHSSYYVVFDDGDKRTLKRTQLVLKGDRHFKESESLDRLPLTNPEQFKNPVMYSSRRKTRCNGGDLDSGEESDSQEEEDLPLDTVSRRSKDTDPSLINRQTKLKQNELRKTDKHSKNHAVGNEIPSRNLPMVGQLVLINLTNSPFSNDKKKTFPAIIVAASASWDTPLKHSQVLVKSFKDNKFYAINKRDFEFLTREHAIKIAQSNKALRLCIEKAVLWLDNRELPPSWDRESLLGETNSVSVSETKSNDHKKQSHKTEKDDEDEEDSSDEDVDLEEKDHWLAMLYEFMEDSGCPMNKAPSLANKDLDLYRLHRLVKTFGGYSRVTSQLKWPLIYSKMSLPSAPAAARHIQSAYKKYLLPFDEMNRKLGSSFHLQLFTSRRGSHSARERRNSGIMQHYNQQMQSQVKVTSPSGASTPAALPATAKETTGPSSLGKKQVPPLASPELKPTKQRPKETKPPILVKESTDENNYNTKESDTSESEKTKESRKRKAASELLQFSSNEKTSSGDETRTRTSRRKRPCNEEDAMSISSRSSCSAAASLTQQKRRSQKSNDSCQDIWEEGLPTVGCRVGVKYGINGNHMYEAKVVQIMDKKSESGVEAESDEQMVVVHYVGWHHRHDETVPLNRIVYLQGDTSGMVNLTKPSLVTNASKTPSLPENVKTKPPSEKCVSSTVTKSKSKIGLQYEKISAIESQDSSYKNKNLDEVSSTASSCATSTTLRAARRLRRDVTLHQGENDKTPDKPSDSGKTDQETSSEKDKNETKEKLPSSSTRRDTRSHHSDERQSSLVRSPVKLRNMQQKRKSPVKANSQSADSDSVKQKDRLSSSDEEEENELPPNKARTDSSGVSSVKRQKRSCVIKRELTESHSCEYSFPGQVEDKATVSSETQEKIIPDLPHSPPTSEGPVTDHVPSQDKVKSRPITRNSRLLSPNLESPSKEECDAKCHLSNSDCESNTTCSTVHMLGQDIKLEQDDVDVEQDTLTSMPSPAVTSGTGVTAASPANNSSLNVRGGRRGRTSRGSWRKRNASQTDSVRTNETPRRQESEDPDLSNEASDVASRPSVTSKRSRRQAWTSATSTPRNVAPQPQNSSLANSTSSHTNTTWMDSQNLSVLPNNSPDTSGVCREDNEPPLCFPSPSFERSTFVRTPDRPFVRLHPNFYPANLDSMPTAEERVAALELALRKVNEAWRKTKQELRDVERRRQKKRARLRALGNNTSSAIFGGASSSSCVNSASPGSGEADTTAAKAEVLSTKDLAANEGEAASNSVVIVQS